MSHASDLTSIRHETDAFYSVVDLVSSWLEVPAEELDRSVEQDARNAAVAAVRALNERCLLGDKEAFHQHSYCFPVFTG